jgi:hypothetical protein
MARIPTAFSCSKELRDKIDARARSLGMNRSQYIIQVLRKDLAVPLSEFNIITDPLFEKKSEKKQY